MTALTLYGPAYSVYTRIVRIVLEEKHIPFTLEEVDFVSSGMPASQKKRHAFGVVPALVHDGETFIETAAISTYLDEAFPEPSLRPRSAAERAHMEATISVLDQYIWPDVRELVTQTYFNSFVGGWPDESITERMIKRLETTLSALDEKFVETGRLGGSELSLADLHAAPMIAYLAKTVEGQVLLQDRPALLAWWNDIKERPSLMATEFDLLDYPWARREDS
jgi:glutathione S-transferase